MALNLISVTLSSGKKIEIGVGTIETVETDDKGVVTIRFLSGHSIIVTDSQVDVAKRANYRTPDGN